MKEKIYFRNSNEELKMGSELIIVTKATNGDARAVSLESIKVTEKTIPYLLQADLIDVKKVKDTITPESIINKFAKHLNADLENTYTFLNGVYIVNEASLTSMLLKKIAVEMDKAYEDHISNTEMIYLISSSNNEIFQTTTSRINLKNVSAFRTKEDAINALVLVHDIKNKITEYFAK